MALYSNIFVTRAVSRQNYPTHPLILGTSVGTFPGISLLSFFATGQTMFLSPMMISPGFGLRFATGIILVVIPCFCLNANDV